MKIAIKLIAATIITGLAMIWAYDFALNQACSGCDTITIEKPMTDYERKQRIKEANEFFSKKITFTSK